MVSIPLELVIFEDYIIANQENFEANQIAVLGQQLKDNSGEDVMNKRITGADATLNRLSTESKKLGGDIDALQAKINNWKYRKNDLIVPLITQQRQGTILHKEVTVKQVPTITQKTEKDTLHLAH